MAKLTEDQFSETVKQAAVALHTYLQHLDGTETVDTNTLLQIWLQTRKLISAIQQRADFEVVETGGCAPPILASQPKDKSRLP